MKTSQTLKLMPKLLPLTLALLCHPTFADLQPSFILKGNLGYSFYNQGYGSKFSWGLGSDVRVTPELEFGVEYRRATLASEDGLDLKAISYLGNAMYRMPLGGHSLAMGLEFGQTSLEVSADLGLISATLATVKKISFGPKVSYEMELSPNWCSSLNLDYLMTLTDPKLNALGLSASIGYKY